ncbi:MAG: hypothetical protein ACFE7R_10375 [Candidatus Hodarchaeota archaeon]
MERKQKGLILVIFGIVFFIISIVTLVYFSELYLPSLLLMFVAVVFIGVGTAIAKNIDASIEMPTDKCYYCKGTGKISGALEEEICPRCGGTGKARVDD